MTPEEQDAEIARLHAFALQLAERLAAASEVLSRLAERRDKRKLETQRPPRPNEETRCMAGRGRRPISDEAWFFGDQDGRPDDTTAYVGVPKCPADLDEVAKKKWKELVRLLAAMDILTKADAT